jgi:hypothetical protein
VGVTKLVAWKKSVFVCLKIWENRSIMASLVNYLLSCAFFCEFQQPGDLVSRQLCTSLLGSSTRSLGVDQHMIVIMNHLYIGVSYNGGTPKWMICSGKSY